MRACPGRLMRRRRGRSGSRVDPAAVLVELEPVPAAATVRASDVGGDLHLIGGVAARRSARRSRGRSAFRGVGELVFCHPERGTIYHPETFKEALTAALAAAGVEKQPRAFHDLRHTAITNDAAAGSGPIAVMTKAGHSDMATTKRYLHLAGVVFRDEADVLERRLGLSTEPSPRPSAPERTSDDPRLAGNGVQASPE
jgi:Phage integrase family